MRCVFCKTGSDSSVSVEHVIPESLGNTEHVMPQGWVCDKCNNYLSREVEKPFLDSVYGRLSRFEMRVANKDGRIPPAIGLLPRSRSKVELFRSAQDGLSLAAAPGEDETKLVQSLLSRKPGETDRLYVPFSGERGCYETSRFIGKIGLEILACRCIDVAGANDEIVDKSELDQLRSYVRLGKPGFVWPVHIRRIYPADFSFPDVASPPFQVLHEFQILSTAESEYYAVIAIFGVEYVINLGGPELDGFQKWLAQNNGRSPLYS
jgi:hypothetical protein